MTTYDIALMDQDFLSQIPWHYAIIDEAQRLKNPSSVSSHFIYVVLLVIQGLTGYFLVVLLFCALWEVFSLIQ
jgi:hypothetical protein